MSMIESRKKNQQAAKDAIDNFIKENQIASNYSDKEMKILLIGYTKLLATYLMTRMENDDCYAIDMMEDLWRLEE